MLFQEPLRNTRRPGAGQAPGTGCPRGANHPSRKIARRSRHVPACAACATQARTRCSTSPRVTVPRPPAVPQPAQAVPKAPHVRRRQPTPPARPQLEAEERHRLRRRRHVRLRRVQQQPPTRQVRRRAVSPRREPTRVVGEQREVSRPGESHPRALAELYVNVSAHTAPIIQPPASAPADASGRTAGARDAETTSRGSTAPPARAVDRRDTQDDATPLLHRVSSTSSLVRVAPPLCLASGFSSLGVGPLDFSLHIETTGSHVPHKGLVQGHATFMPGADQPSCRLPLDSSRVNDSPRFRHRPYAFDTLPVVHPLRLPAPYLTRSRRAVSVTLTTPALDRSSARRFGASPCRAAPRGLPSSLVQHGCS